ncbi:MAG: LPS export ABC transporter ATP-binding protein [Planctomycetota bacterium]|nr:MAG: LPS export ABC transporter ATP-binding protein [Planctomycetota bacterium]
MPLPRGDRPVAEGVAAAVRAGSSPLLEASKLRKVYGRRTVVHDVALRVERGEIVGLLGRNGAGKTTTFRMTMGLVRPDGGTVRFAGRDVTRLPLYRRARLGMGYLSQEPAIFRQLTVEDNLLAILERVERSRSERARRLEELIAQFGLGAVRHNRARRLSGGERRRLEIARTLVTRPSLILLDEPFSGVDPIAVQDIQKIVLGLRERGIGILLTDHNVRETLRITDRAYIMLDGRILVSGTPQQVVADPTARRVYLGEEFEL